MCDIILASPTATFGQPEITLGVTPGGGGTQRLTHIVGKYRAMELMLTGRNITAEEAERWGLVNRIVGEGEGKVVEEAVEMAEKIAGFGKVAVQATKELVNAGELPSALTNRGKLIPEWFYLKLISPRVATFSRGYI